LAVPFHKSQRNYEEIIQTLVNEMELTGNNWQLARIQEETSIDKNTIILAQTSNRPSYSKRPKNDFDLIYLFVNASQKLDRYQLDQLKGWQDLNIPIQCIMVDTKIQYLEKFLGDIPKNRSRLRRRIKDILKRYS